MCVTLDFWQGGHLLNLVLGGEKQSNGPIVYPRPAIFKRWIATRSQKQDETENSRISKCTLLHIGVDKERVGNH